MKDDRGLFSALVGDGRPLILVTGLSLVLSGAFAFFLSARGHFLPHDVDYLGMTPEALCAVNECRIVHFMFHDRVSFGGALVAIGVLYLWLAAIPLARGEAWSWWLLALSGILGFGSFLAYLGYGYLDTWHGAATLALLPCFVLGVSRAKPLIPRGSSPLTLLRPNVPLEWRTSLGWGRMALLATALGLIGGGGTILIVGMTTVFVPQDLAYMGITAREFDAINPRLVPLIAHDRAGFGGAVLTCGVLVLFCTWCGRPSRSLWQALCVAGGVGFSTAIGVHPLIGYTDTTHLAPAVLGAVSFGVGITLTWRPMMQHSVANGDGTAPAGSLIA
ncbi:MAG: hypothetical protein KF708_24180 [Pirellulales bacterium]|nr:hypothetical protein [Pirellulales bacterium]